MSEFLTPSIVITVPVMDRAQQLDESLTSLLEQDYPNYYVAVVDHGSRDGIDDVLRRHADARLRMIRVPRPRYWNFARGENVALRHAKAELVFVGAADTSFRDETHLSEIVHAYFDSSEIDYHWWQDWRKYAGYSCIRAAAALSLIQCQYRRAYCQSGGGLLLVERAALLSSGGYNELLEGWGYEDTDVFARLELSGFGRIGFDGMQVREHTDFLRLANYRFKDREVTWQRNRILSDQAISEIGVVAPNRRRPGVTPWVEIDGVRYRERDAPSEDWVIKAGLRFWLRRDSLRLRSRLGVFQRAAGVAIRRRLSASAASPGP